MRTAERVTAADPERAKLPRMLNKVPEITIFFWIIKVLATTIGETAADYLNETLKLGLTNTTWVLSGLFLIALYFQMKARRYVPGLYWLVVVLISIVGTLFSDNLVDNLGVSLWTTTIGFAICLAITFTVWYVYEKTLSVHTIYTFKREAFYWCAILFTFALGTSAGDLTAEKLNLGYALSIFIFGGLIAAIAIAHFKFRLHAITSFWMAYVLTRPLGASIGDYLSSKPHAGGVGLGTTATSFVFLTTIAAVVIYLGISKRDQPPPLDLVEEVAEGTPASVSPTGRPVHVLVVANRASSTPELLEAIRHRAAAGPAAFHLLVPHTSDPSWHMLHPERRAKMDEAKLVLDRALPALEQAAGGAPVTGSVSIREDPMDAVEEALWSGYYEEIILSTHPHPLSERLHIDLTHRLDQLGLPLTTASSLQLQ